MLSYIQVCKPLWGDSGAHSRRLTWKHPELKYGGVSSCHLSCRTCINPQEIGQRYQPMLQPGPAQLQMVIQRTWKQHFKLLRIPYNLTLLSKAAVLTDVSP